MDEAAAGPVGAIVWIALAVVGALAVTGAGLWIGDYGLEATVVGKDCSPLSGGVLGGGQGGSTSRVTVRTKVLGIDHTVTDFPDRQCHTLRAGEDGNFVRYHVRSQHTTLYEREGGPCIWDSTRGLGC